MRAIMAGHRAGVAHAPPHVPLLVRAPRVASDAARSAPLLEHCDVAEPQPRAAEVIDVGRSELVELRVVVEDLGSRVRVVVRVGGWGLGSDEVQMKIK